MHVSERLWAHQGFYSLGPTGSFGRDKREARQSSPFSVEAKNAMELYFQPPHVFIAWWLINHRDCLLFNNNNNSNNNNNIAGTHKIKDIHKTAIFGPAHIIRKVLIYKYKTFSMGNSSTRAMNCNCKIAATLYTL
jgi:hypothetical protein